MEYRTASYSSILVSSKLFHDRESACCSVEIAGKREMAKKIECHGTSWLFKWARSGLKPTKTQAVVNIVCKKTGQFVF